MLTLFKMSCFCRQKKKKTNNKSTRVKIYDNVYTEPPLGGLGGTTVEWIPNQKLLICDDAFGNRLVLKKYFDRYGYTSDQAQNGKEAIQLAKQHGVYDILWIDVKMPIMNGIDCTRALRSLGYPGIIIGITGFTDQEITKECLSVGMNFVITKPITKEVLLTYLEKYCKTPPKN